MFRTILFLILLIPHFLECHNQFTHKYMTYTAYQLLKSDFGIIPAMDEHIGQTDESYNGDYAFQLPFITTGSFREDEEDLVFGFDGYLLSGWDIDIDDWIVSITHFWDADNGNTAMNYFIATTLLHAHTPLGTFPNSYQKLLQFAYPNKFWEIKYTLTPGTSTFNLWNGGTKIISQYGGVGFKYNSLIELYKTGHAWLTGYYGLQGEWNACDYEIALGEDWRDHIVWEILGRMGHFHRILSTVLSTPRMEASQIFA